MVGVAYDLLSCRHNGVDRLVVVDDFHTDDTLLLRLGESLHQLRERLQGLG